MTANKKISIEIIKKKILPILKRHKTKRAGLFGSVAQGDFKRSSDIDILVDLPRSLNLLDVVGIQQEIEDAMDKKVDLVQYDAIKPFLKNYILSQEIRIL